MKKRCDFECPACKHKISVGKKLHAGYTCNNCNSQMLITRDELLNGKLDYSKAKTYHHFNKKEI